jgi:hypothetical protein
MAVGGGQLYMDGNQIYLVFIGWPCISFSRFFLEHTTYPPLQIAEAALIGRNPQKENHHIYSLVKVDLESDGIRIF